MGEIETSLGAAIGRLGGTITPPEADLIDKNELCRLVAGFGIFVIGDAVVSACWGVPLSRVTVSGSGIGGYGIAADRILVR